MRLRASGQSQGQVSFREPPDDPSRVVMMAMKLPQYLSLARRSVGTYNGRVAAHVGVGGSHARILRRRDAAVCRSAARLRVIACSTRSPDLSMSGMTQSVVEIVTLRIEMSRMAVSDMNPYIEIGSSRGEESMQITRFIRSFVHTHSASQQSPSGGVGPTPSGDFRSRRRSTGRASCRRVHIPIRWPARRSSLLHL